MPNPKARADAGRSAVDGAKAVERTYRITVDLPEELHRALRVRVAIDAEVPDAMSFVRSLLAEALAEEVALANGLDKKRQARKALPS
jgi:Arc/MetJ-type ribon-helix-helix transcriptional regulator